jgi:hypothetical protein
MQTGDEFEALITAMARDDWISVAELEAQLDAAEAERPIPTLIGAALWYAEQGLRVFPLQPNSKVPYPGSRGFEDATSERGDLLDWWRHRPSSNIGLATGWQIDVIDIDGIHGWRSWQGIENLPPVIGVVSTPRAGGNHMYVPATGRGNRAGVLPQIDYRGKGGYVVAPPSYVIERAKGYEGRYRWRRPLNLGLVVPPDDASSSGDTAPGVTGEHPTHCTVCGNAMDVVEPGQSTHPGCAP